MSTFRYTGSQITTHWMSVLVILFLLVTGSLVLADLPNTVEKIGNLRIHMILGGLAAILVVVRIILKKNSPKPDPISGSKRASAGHIALNIVVLLLVMSGVMLSLQSGAFDATFGNGTLPEDFFHYTPRKIHGLLSRIIMGLIALHILAALYHQLFLKDGLVARMFPGK
ncbi:MAG: cytochrome b [Gammaproteobacteria bacterium]|nr:cytochrome b [Gammaproteobacteria bacterium]